MEMEANSARPAEWKKYYKYAIDVDPDQDDKSKEILLHSSERPHMRAFHCSWWGFFAAFFIWFAVSPLLGEIRDDLDITDHEIWTSSIAGVGSTVVVRVIMGPLCDVYGARVLFSAVLCLASIPAACTGLIQNATDLIVVRFFTGIAGGTFVTCQYWTSRMFTKEVIGTVNGLAGGWGNLGAGVTHLVMGSILFPLFTGIFDDDSEKAWRCVCVVPAVVSFVSGIVIYRISDDAPKGNYSELKSYGVFPHPTSACESLVRASWNRNTWVLFVQYACCFGVELTMNNAAAMYFRDEYGQSTMVAAAITSVFGWLNLFARGLGGFTSDYCHSRWGMRGRICLQMIFLFLEGVLVFVFAATETMAGSIVSLVFFSILVQAAEGTTFAVVPYVDPRHMGSVIGLVGAGGNVGAVAFGLAFRELDYSSAFNVMKWFVLASCFLSVIIDIDGYSTLLGGEDVPVDQETGERIAKNEEGDDQKQSQVEMVRREA